MVISPAVAVCCCVTGNEIQNKQVCLVHFSSRSPLLFLPFALVPLFFLLLSFFVLSFSFFLNQPVVMLSGIC